MKTSARYAWAMSAVTLMVFLAGCATPRTARYYRTVPISEFTVVSSSSNRKLSSAEMDQLQAGVEKFLAGQGLGRSGDYMVRIDFAPTVPGAPADWVLVKLSNPPAPNLALAENYSDESPVEYSYPYVDAYGFAPYGYGDAFGFYYPWDFHRTSPVVHHDGHDHHHPGEYHPGDRHDPPGGYAGGGHDNHHPGGQPPRGGGQPGRDHTPPTRTAGYTPHFPDGGGRSGGGAPHSPPPPRGDSPAPAPAARPATSGDASARDNRMK